jgi:hypothetical protein
MTITVYTKIPITIDGTPFSKSAVYRTAAAIGAEANSET